MLSRFFKKQAPEKVEREVAVMEPKATKYPSIVEEIHNEFETAADRLAESAKQIIAEAKSKDASKVERLINLGFKQSNQVSEVKPLLEKAKLSEEQVKLLNDYATRYPFNKFITEGQVEVICKKYNLVCGDVDRYKGFVPEKNLREVEKFKLKSVDEGLFTSNGHFLINAEVRRTGAYFHIYKKGGNSYAFQSNEGTDFYFNDSLNIFGLANLGWTRFNISKSKFKICAPVKDMDLKGLELKDGYKLQKIHVPDPVVLQPVNGGYLIVTKWGDEENDQILLNTINN